jgi:serine/threonine protein kinase/Leucine-rich repeat (LRR) protein
MALDDRLSDLLVDWEQSQRDGREPSLEELCKNAPELLPVVRESIDSLKATRWMLEPDTTGTWGDDRSSDGLRAALHDTELPASHLTVEEFAASIFQSGLLSAEEIRELNERLAASLLPGEAREVASRLVTEGKLTRYQASVLLKASKDPLLIDNYVILDTLETGGMGLVFKALHRSMNRVVALKLLPAAMMSARDTVKRFQREVHAAAALSHPNIVAAYDAHQSDEIAYLVLEFVEGTNLFRLVKDHGPLPVATAANYVRQAALGLAYLHSRGIIHRDVKPANLILAGDGTVKLLDMGLVRFASLEDLSCSEMDQELTQAGIVIGTVAYMSPEQALDTRSADQRSDIYSLGCTLFFLLTGRSLYHEETGMKTLLAHRELPVPSIREFCEDAPVSLDAVFRTMVAKRPADRLQSMTEVVAALDACVPGAALNSPASMPPRQVAANARSGASPLARGWQRVRSSPAGLALAITLLVALLTGGTYLAGMIIRIKTRQGITEVRVDDPDAEVTVRKDGDTSKDVQSLFPGIKLDFRSTATKASAKSPQQQRAEAAKLWESVHNPNVKSSADAVDYVEQKLIDEYPNTEFAVRAREEQAQASRASKRAASTPAQPPGETDRKLAEWALKLGARVGDGDTWMNSIKDIPDRPFRVTFIQFDGADDGVLAQLAQFHPRELRFVALEGTKVTDNGMASLASIPWLLMLSLSETQIGDQGAKHLSTLPALQDLDLSKTRITDKSLEYLSNLATLTDLKLVGTQITDQGIANLPRLKTLSLAETKITDAALKSLERQSWLRKLDLMRTHVTKPAVAKLQAALPNCEIRDDFALESIKEQSKTPSRNLPAQTDRKLAEWVVKLGGVCVSGTTNIGSAGAIPAGPFDISSIYFSGTEEVGDADLQELAAFRPRRLRMLQLHHQRLTDEGLDALREIPRLVVLDLSNTPITDAGVKTLSALTQLQELDLSQTQITDKALGLLAALPRLTDLTLDQTQITDQGLARLPQLKSLSLKRTATSDAGLKHLEKQRGLTKLNISFTRVSQSGIAELKAALPICEIEAQIPQAPATNRVGGLPSEILQDLQAGNQQQRADAAKAWENVQKWKTKGVPVGIAVHCLEIIRYYPNTEFAAKAREELAKLSPDDIQHARPMVFESPQKQKTQPPEKEEFVAPAAAGPNESVDRQVAKWLLSAPGRLVWVRRGGVEFLLDRFGNATSPPGDFEIVGITVQSPPSEPLRFNEPDIERLASLSKLQSLNLPVQAITDREVRLLAKLTNLTRLSLATTKITDACLPALAGMKQLSGLDLSGTAITDAGLEQLAKMKSLGDPRLVPEDQRNKTEMKIDPQQRPLPSLDLGYTKTTEAGLLKLQQALPNCTIFASHIFPGPIGHNDFPLPPRVGSSDREWAHWLFDHNLLQCWVFADLDPDTAIQQIQDLPPIDFHIQKLRFAGLPGSVCDLNAFFFRRLGELQGLRELRIDREIPADSLRGLSTIKSLQRLIISHGGADDDSLRVLASLTGLKTLIFGGNHVTDAGIRSLAPLKQLTELSVSGHAREVHGSGFEALRGTNTLRSLDVSGSGLDDDGASRIGQLTSLERLNLRDTWISGEGLAALAGLTHLKDLNLSRCRRLQTNDLTHLSRLATLEKLDLSDCRITDESMRSLVDVLKKLKNLRLLNLNGTRVSLQMINEVNRSKDDILPPQLGIAWPSQPAPADPDWGTNKSPEPAKSPAPAAPPGLRRQGRGARGPDEKAEHPTSGRTPNDQETKAPNAKLPDQGPKQKAVESPAGAGVWAPSIDAAKEFAAKARDELGRLDPAPLPPPPKPGSTDRDWANWLLGIPSLRCHLVVDVDPHSAFRKLEDIPPMDFHIERMSLGPPRMGNSEPNPVNAVLLRGLSDLPRLRRLDLNGKISPAALNGLAAPSSLEELVLWDAEAGDDVIKGLPAMTGLTKLQLNSHVMTDAGLEHVAGCKNLIELSLSGDPRYVHGNGLDALRGIATLRSLYLSGSGIPDDGVRHIAQLAGLEMLDLSGTAISGQGMAELAKLKHLKRLRLMHCRRLHSRDLAPLVELPDLERLSLADSPIDDAAVETLKRLKSLRTLVVERTGMTPEVIRELQRAFPPAAAGKWEGSNPGTSLDLTKQFSFFVGLTH